MLSLGTHICDVWGPVFTFASPDVSHLTKVILQMSYISAMIAYT